MTIRDTLTRAIRMTGARALGDDPEAEEINLALATVQNMLLALPRPNLTDVLISANYTANENERVTITSGTPVVTTPTTVVDSKTGQPRPPTDGAVVIVTGAAPKYWFYSKPLATWTDLNALTLLSIQPLGPEMEEGLAAMVAVRAAPDLQQPQIPQWVVELATQGRKAILQRFRQPFTATTDPLLLNVFQRNGTAL